MRRLPEANHFDSTTALRDTDVIEQIAAIAKIDAEKAEERRKSDVAYQRLQTSLKEWEAKIRKVDQKLQSQERKVKNLRYERAYGHRPVAGSLVADELRLGELRGEKRFLERQAAGIRKAIKKLDRERIR